MSNPNPPGTPQDQIAAAINAVQSERPGQIPLEVNLSTGQVYKADTPQDLLNKLAAAQEEATRTIRAREGEMADLRNQMAELKAQIPPPPPPSADQDKLNEYYKTWSSNPNKATTMALAQEMGIPEDRLVPMLKTAIEGQAVNTASSEFLARCPDFPETSENAQLIRQGILQRYGGNAGAMTADNLELVYHDLVRNGRITPNSMQPTGFAQPNVPIPNLRGGSAPPSPVNDIMAQAHEMPIDDLKRVIDRLHSQMAAR